MWYMQAHTDVHGSCWGQAKPVKGRWHGDQDTVVWSREEEAEAGTDLFVSCYVIKYWPKATRRGGFDLQLPGHRLSGKAKAWTWCRNHGRILLAGLFMDSCLLSKTARAVCPGNGAAHSGLGHTIISKAISHRYSYRLIWSGQFLSWDALLRWL